MVSQRNRIFVLAQVVGRFILKLKLVSPSGLVVLYLAEWVAFMGKIRDSCFLIVQIGWQGVDVYENT